MAVVVETSLLCVVDATAVDDKVFEDCFTFVLTREVILLAFVDQVVFAFVVEALVPLVSASAWFARKLS